MRFWGIYNIYYIVYTHMDIYSDMIAWFMCVNFVNDMAQRSQTLGYPCSVGRAHESLFLGPT